MNKSLILFFNIFIIIINILPIVIWFNIAFSSKEFRWMFFLNQFLFQFVVGWGSDALVARAAVQPTEADADGVHRVQVIV